MLGKDFRGERVVGGHGRCRKTVVVVGQVVDVDAQCRKLGATASEERDSSSEPFRKFTGRLSGEGQPENFLRPNPPGRDEPQRAQRHGFCLATSGARENKVDALGAHVNDVGLFWNGFEPESEEFVQHAGIEIIHQSSPPGF